MGSRVPVGGTAALMREHKPTYGASRRQPTVPVVDDGDGHIRRLH